MPEEGIDQVRSQLDEVTKELKQIQADNEKLTSQNRLLLGENAFRDAGLNPNLAKLYVADPSAELSSDAAKAFAEAYGIPAGEPAIASGGESVPAPTPAPAGDPSMSAMSGAGSRGGDGGQPAAGTKTLTTQEYEELARTDKVAAEKAVAEGRVQLSDLNGWNKDRPNLTGHNPYAAFHKEAAEQS